jgi:hypothetical protein
MGAMNTSQQSPASKVFDEAIELAIEERSPFPERSMFVDADSPALDTLMEQAADEKCSVVLVAADGSTEIVTPKRN